MEKTPENSFRVPHLLDLFPDARFLVIWRNPLLVLRSLIRGWRDPAGRFRSYFVSEDLRIPGYPHRRMWRFTLPTSDRRANGAVEDKMEARVGIEPTNKGCKPAPVDASIAQ